MAKSIKIAWLFHIVVFFLKQYQRQLLLRNSLTQSRWESLHRQELDEERMRFFTNIIHELRTPITLILGPIEDLADDNSLSDRLRKRLKGVLASAERLLGLVNELLEFRKTDTEPTPHGSKSRLGCTDTRGGHELQRDGRQAGHHA